MSPRESIIPVFVPHLGCPYQCVFCNQNHISGAEKPASAEDVRAAVQEAMLLPDTGVPRQLAFYGGSFTAIPVAQQEELLQAAYPYAESGFLQSLRLSTRPDAIDEETLRRLCRYGVETIELGAQSLVDEVLLRSGRGHTVADVEEASRMIKAHGFRLILQMMTGLPGDSPERTVTTAKKIIALQPDGVRIYPTVVVRDTPLYHLWRCGQYSEHTVEEAVEYCAAILPLFAEAGIPVIRLGLNPTEELSGGSAVGGAYHPALGELVRSRIWRNRAEALLREAAVTEGECAELVVHPSMVSQMTGQRRANVKWLKESFRLQELRVVPEASANRDSLRLIDDKTTETTDYRG